MIHEFLARGLKISCSNLLLGIRKKEKWRVVPNAPGKITNPLFGQTLPCKRLGEVLVGNLDHLLLFFRGGNQFLEFLFVGRCIQWQFNDLVRQGGVKHRIGQFHRVKPFPSRSDQRLAIQDGIDKVLGPHTRHPAWQNRS